MSDELTRQMLERWKASADAAADKPDRAAVAADFGAFLRGRLDEDTTPRGVAAALQAHFTNDQQEN